MTTSHQHLEALLADLFPTTDELRRHLHHGPQGTEVVDNVPECGTPAQLRHDLVRALNAAGLIDRAFFERLEEVRSARREDIRSVAVAWGVDMTGSSTTRPVFSPVPAASTPVTGTEGSRDGGGRAPLGQGSQFVENQAKIAQQINVVGDAHFHRAAVGWSSRPRIVLALLALAGLASFTWVASAPGPAEPPTAGGVTIRADGCGSTGVGGNVDAEVDGMDVSATRGGKAIQGDLKVSGTSSEAPSSDDKSQTGRAP